MVVVVMSVGADDSVAVVDGQGIQDLFPAVDPADEVGPVWALLVGDKVEHFECGVDSTGCRNTVWILSFESSRSSASAGVRQPSRLRGRLFSWAATNSR